MIGVKLHQQWLADDMPFAIEHVKKEKREPIKLSEEAKRKQQELLDKWDF